MKKCRCGTMPQDYKGHGTTALFAALNALDSTVIGRCMHRLRHEVFIRFLNVTGVRHRTGRIARFVARSGNMAGIN
jgi:hypothetical protein